MSNTEIYRFATINKQICKSEYVDLDKEIDDRGNITYLKSGTDIFHRKDGPAYIQPDGHKEWYFEDQLHRVDGPAIEWASGSGHWYKQGLMHREDGPALESNDGNNYWYYEGESIDCQNQEEFERVIKLKVFW